MSSNPPQVKSNSSQRFLTGAIIFIILWYVTLCVQHYFNQRPFWNDEQAVFASVEHFTPSEMFGKKLAVLQVFPRCYLFLIQQISKPFDFHLLAVRFLPFVFMLSAFTMWLKIASYEFREKLAYFTYVLSWAGSLKLIYYSAELKQYSLDVFVGSLFILFFYNREKILQSQPGRYLLTVGLFPILGLFSYIGFFFSLILLYNLGVDALKNRERVKYALTTILSLALCVTISYNIDMKYRHLVIVTEGFNDYFVHYDTFYQFIKTSGSGVRNLFIRWFVEYPKPLRRVSVFFGIIGFSYMFYGFFKNFKKDEFSIKSLHTLGFVMFFGLFLLAVAKKYPWGIPRTTLFFCPVILFMMLKGIYKIKEINKYLYVAVHGFYITYLIFISLGIAQHIFSGDFGGMAYLWESLFPRS